MIYERNNLRSTEVGEHLEAIVIDWKWTESLSIAMDGDIEKEIATE